MTERSAVQEQAGLIATLVESMTQQGTPVVQFETHISTIVVAGPFAYKFKKPVCFDFLDFTTLAARHFYCKEELRLNRRLAPALYLDVLALHGPRAQPQWGGSGAVLDYAVQMRAFPQEALWSRRCAAGLLGAPEIDALARQLTDFHQTVAIAEPGRPWGGPPLLREVADDNLAQIAALPGLPGFDALQAELACLRAWQDAQFRRLDSVFVQRKMQHAIRECHGDLHCGNILTLDGAVTLFDCIEFSDTLRWIDVIDELAFICMDLEWRGLPRLAARLLNACLEASGDYAGLAVFNYYRVERALVRCKVEMLRASQLAEGGAPARQARSHFDYALAHIAPAAPVLILMHGLSGSGKSTVSQDLLESLGAVRLRSDVERKRLHGLAALAPAASAFGTGLYAQAANLQTYAQLRALARRALESGLPVIVDAAFLKGAQRDLFAALADELDVPFFIVSVQAERATLQARVAARALAGADPSDAGPAVLAQQMAQQQPLSAAERARAVVVDTTTDLPGCRRDWRYENGYLWLA